MLTSASCAALGATDSNDTGSSAQSDQSAGALAEIVVTAEKRSESLQTTPISITALTDKALDNEQVRNLNDITALVPSLKMGQNDGYQQITIRGIGNTNFQPAGDGSVAVNVDGVYVSRPIAQATSLYDISQVEVVRGPQGTLYGRNASAGSVNVTTNMPTDAFSGYGKVSYGNFNDIYTEGAVGGAVVDDLLLVRIAGFSENRNGYGENIVTGNQVENRNAQAIRATVVFTPVADVKATVIAERFTEKDNGAALHYFGETGLSGLPGALGLPPQTALFGGYQTTNPWNVATGLDSKFELNTTAFTGTLEWTPGAFSFRSISAYRGQDSNTFTPLDGGSTSNFTYVAGEPAYQFSQELQAHYDVSQFHGVLGLYYFSEQDNYEPGIVYATGELLNFFAPSAPPRPDTELYRFTDIGGLFFTEAEAAFAQGTYDVGAGFSLTGGIRYSYEHKKLFQRYSFSFDTPAEGTVEPAAVEQPAQTYTATTPKAGVQYQIDAKTMVYASYSKGFKAGGFDTGSYPAASFQPEYIKDYETGLKSTWLDNRLRTNIDGFYYDYKNLQVQQIIGNTIETSNAASAHVYGAEAEITAVPFDPLTVTGLFSWLHARYVNYFGADPALPLATANSNFSGKALDNAPDFTAHFSVEYMWHIPSGTLALRGEADYSSKFYFAPDNFAVLSQGAYTKGNGFLTYNDARNWYATAFVRNVSDAATKTSAIVNTPLDGNPVQGTYAPPRTFGVELGYRF
jgi:iron complex outermembrane recepter protein